MAAPMKSPAPMTAAVAFLAVMSPSGPFKDAVIPSAFISVILTLINADNLGTPLSFAV
jgi:hypothetical protein